MNPTPIRWGDVTVPYTVMWTAEFECPDKQRVVEEKWAGQKLLMLSDGIDRREGKPLFKMLHADRCRYVLRHALCQMCLECLPNRVVTINQGEVDGLRPLISDGLPMCPQCALEAVRACPGMQRQYAAGTLRMWCSASGAWNFAPVMLRPIPNYSGGDAEINRLLMTWAPRIVFRGPKLVLSRFIQIKTIEDLEVMANE